MPNRSWEGCDVDDPSAGVLANYGGQRVLRYRFPRLRDEMKGECPMETKATDLTELFGSMVFNEDAMRQYLSSNSFSAWKECIENQTALDLAIANDIADAMKHWAIERGATHFTTGSSL